MLVRIAAPMKLSCPQLWHVTGEFLSSPPEVESSVGSSSGSDNGADPTVPLVSYQQKGGFGKSWLRAGSLFFFKPLSPHITSAVCIGGFLKQGGRGEHHFPTC